MGYASQVFLQFASDLLFGPVVEGVVEPSERMGWRDEDQPVEGVLSVGFVQYSCDLAHKILLVGPVQVLARFDSVAGRAGAFMDPPGPLGAEVVRFVVYLGRNKFPLDVKNVLPVSLQQ